MNTEQHTGDQGTAAAGAGVRPGQLRPVPFRYHPRMVYNDPDAFFLELLMDDRCERIDEQDAILTLLETDRDNPRKVSGTAPLLQAVSIMEAGSSQPAGSAGCTE